MQIKLLFALFGILITSCNLRQRANFDFIDLSIYKDRPQEYYSLKIFQDGKVYVSFKENVNAFKENKYVFTLDRYTIDTISLLTKSIVNSKFDSVYYTDCLSCVNFNLIIKAKENRIKIYHIGDLQSNDRYKILEDYITYLNRLIDRSIVIVDSSFKFESSTDRLLPPPPPTTDSLSKID